MVGGDIISPTEIAFTELIGWIALIAYTRNSPLWVSFLSFILFEVAFSGWMYFIITRGMVK